MSFTVFVFFGFSGCVKTTTHTDTQDHPECNFVNQDIPSGNLTALGIHHFHWSMIMLIIRKWSIIHIYHYVYPYKSGIASKA